MKHQNPQRYTVIIGDRSKEGYEPVEKYWNFFDSYSEAKKNGYKNALDWGISPPNIIVSAFRG